jgi:hypothetical protein
MTVVNWEKEKLSAVREKIKAVGGIGSKKNVTSTITGTVHEIKMVEKRWNR